MSSANCKSLSWPRCLNDDGVQLLALKRLMTHVAIADVLATWTSIIRALPRESSQLAR